MPKGRKLGSMDAAAAAMALYRGEMKWETFICGIDRKAGVKMCGIEPNLCDYTVRM